MSVYRDTNATVTFEHPFPGPLTAIVYKDGQEIHRQVGLMPAPNYELELTYVQTQFDGRLDIEWVGGTWDNPFKRTTSVEVITPLVSLSDLKTVFQDVHIADGELKDLEEQVRIFIETYTQQDFGYEIGTCSVVGNGEKKIALPKRLMRVHRIKGGPVGYFNTSNDGWYLYVGNKNYFTIKEMPPEDYIDNVQLVSGVIVVPDSYWKKFRSGTTYEIEGEWGYYSVPDDIRQAALLLAKDYGSGETIYRDRYLESMKSGDWNLMYSAGAFRGTGNKRADDLLEPYRRQGMVII